VLVGLLGSERAILRERAADALNTLAEDDANKTAINVAKHKLGRV
jgi:hypothetical protein